MLVWGLGRHCETWRGVLGVVRNLGFWRIAKLRGANWDVRKLGIYANEKLGVCNRGICETSWYSWKLRGYFVVWVRCVRCLPFLPFQCVQPFRLSCILGTFVGVKELKRGYYLRYIYIFRFGVGVVAV